MCMGDIMAKKKNQRKNNSSKPKVTDTKKSKTTKQVSNKTAEVEKVEEVAEKETTVKVDEKIISSSKTTTSSTDKKKTIERVRRDLIYSQNDSSDEISKLARIVLIVTAILVLFYGITVFVTRRVNAVKTAKLGKSDEKSEIQYDSILIGTMFNIEGRHFVLIYSEDDEHYEEYNNLLKTIEVNDEAPKVYKAILDESFNKMYLASESNYDSDLSKFKVKGTTLVEIDGDIKSTYDDYDSIKNKLNEFN